MGFGSPRMFCGFIFNRTQKDVHKLRRFLLRSLRLLLLNLVLQSLSVFTCPIILQTQKFLQKVTKETKNGVWTAGGSPKVKHIPRFVLRSLRLLLLNRGFENLSISSSFLP